MFICHKQRKCLSPEHWVAHSRGVCPGTATHSYVMPYLQSADHMHFQIPNWNYWHYHNHLDTHTAGRASQLADCVQSRAKTPTGWAQDMYCSTYSLPVRQTLYHLMTLLYWPRLTGPALIKEYMQSFNWIVQTYICYVAFRDWQSPTGTLTSIVQISELK